MTKVFEIVAPAGVLTKYQQMFESEGIFYTQLLPVNNPTHVVLEDTNNMYLDRDGWIIQISVIVGSILQQEILSFTNKSANSIEIFLKS